MATKGHLTGMLGVYLTAAELTRRGLIVSVTSRSARGVDLLAVDDKHLHTWSIQVKTNRRPATFWLLNPSFREQVAPQHVYVFVNIRGQDRPEYYVVPSEHVARTGETTEPRANGQRWHSWYKRAGPEFHDDWSLFDAQ